MSSTDFEGALERAEDYADSVLTGERPSGKIERLAVARWKRDLDTGVGGKYRFDDAKASRVIFFLEQLRHVVGDEAGRGEKLTLLPWQAFAVANMFGWVDEAGLRRFRIAYIQVARGSGKSFLTAGLGLYMLCADGETSPACYIAATTSKQSKIIFDYVSGVVRRCPDLRRRWGLKITGGESRTGKVSVGDTLGNLIHLCRENSGSWDGFRPSFAVCDELHAHPKEDSWNALQGGMQTRGQPLILGISTAGLASEGVAWERRKDLQMVLEGKADDERFWGISYEPDRADMDGDGWTHPDVWRKACPSLGEGVKVEAYETACSEAQRRPAKRRSFFVKMLNYWLAGSEGWVDEEEYDACGRHPRDYPEMTWAQLEGKACYLGVDLASVSDLSSICYLFPEGDVWRVKHRNYASGAQIAADEIYQKWRDDGWLEEAGDKVIDLDQVLQRIMEDLERFSVLGIGYDPHQGRILAQQISKADHDLKILSISQNGAAPNFGLKEIEDKVKRGRWLHDCNPVTKWCVRNSRIRVTIGGFQSLDRSNRDAKVDAVDAACNAVNIRHHYLAADEEEEVSSGIVEIDWDAI